MDELTRFAKTNTAARLRAAAARGALGHALIFSGAGDRLSAARYAAAALECTGADKPCLACAHCRKVLADIHPDVTTVRDDEHTEIAVDVIRAVRSDAFIRPNEGKCKVYLFPDCTVLNEKDQNVLLKTVEGGPPYAAFFFCAENGSALLPTIRSRCVEIKLPPSSAETGGDERALSFARVLAEGNGTARAAFLVELETARLSREALGALFEQTRVLFADALCALCGAPPQTPHDEETLHILTTSRLTKAQILGTIELLETYRDHCNYNVGVGPLLGGLAVELEEIL